MSDREFERAVVDWLEDGSDRTPKRAIDGVLLAVKTTPQERDHRIPWRLPQMLAQPRATGVAAMALVAVVGVGGLAYLINRLPGGTGGPPAQPPATQAPTPTPTVAPTTEPTRGPSEVIKWTPYTSEVYGYSLEYPEGYEAWPATREWRPGDGEGFEDYFVSADDDMAFSVVLIPAGTGVDLESVDGLQAWAETYCNGVALQDPPDVDRRCLGFTHRAEPMCLNAGGDPCRAAVLLRSVRGLDPAEYGEFAIFPTSDLDKVYVVATGRGDAWPGAAKYGGAVQLLKDVIATMGVTEP